MINALAYFCLAYLLTLFPYLPRSSWHVFRQFYPGCTWHVWHMLRSHGAHTTPELAMCLLDPFGSFWVRGRRQWISKNQSSPVWHVPSQSLRTSHHQWSLLSLVAFHPDPTDLPSVVRSKWFRFSVKVWNVSSCTTYIYMYILYIYIYTHQNHLYKPL